MELILAEHNDCLLASAAMITDIPLEVFRESVFTPYLVHIYEVQNILVKYGFTLTPIPKMPLLELKDGFRQLTDKGSADQLFNAWLYNRKALLIEDTHACAWDGASVYDPRGRVMRGSCAAQYIESRVREAWVLSRDLTN